MFESTLLALEKLIPNPTVGIVIKRILLGISLAAPVGPVSIEVIKRGLKGGFKAAFPVCLGGATGDAICLVLAYLGLSQFVDIPSIRLVIWMFGSFVLLYLGTQSIRDGLRKEYVLPNTKQRISNAFVLGIILAIANPISIVWWVGIFGGVLSESPDQGYSLRALLGYSFIIVGVIIWSLFLSTLLSFGKRFIKEKLFRLISILAGCSLLGFGISFIYRATLELLLRLKG